MNRAPSFRRVAVSTVWLAALLGFVPSAGAQSADDPPVRLVVDAGRPLRVALDRRTFIDRVGQPVSGTLTEPLYAYDRIVVPAGARVTGRVAKLEGRGKTARLRGMLAGDFSPRRRVSLEFDNLILADGRELAIATEASFGTGHVVLRAVPGSEQSGITSRAKQEVAGRAKEAAAIVTAPGKRERALDMAIRSLPYHKQFLQKGTTFSAPLTSALDFGSADPAPRAAAGAMPKPDSILYARLTTPSRAMS